MRERRGAWLLGAGALVLLGACGGGGNNAAGSPRGAAQGAAPTPATPATPAATPSAAQATPAGGAATAGKALAPTGKTVDVKMLGDEKGYRYDPASVTIRVGDAVRFINVSGGPHNVDFASVPEAAQARLAANMPASTADGAGPKLGTTSGPLLVGPNDTYTISFAGVPPGTYAFLCVPHMAEGMKGQLTVQ